MGTRNVMKIFDLLFGFINVRGHTFYSKILNPASIVLDLGANIGDFSKYIASKYKCNTFAVEASPILFSKIEETNLIHKYNYAVAKINGVVTFYESTKIDAGNILAPKSNSTGKTLYVNSRKFASLVSELRLKEIDLLKIDIEGSEIELFDSINEQDLACVKQLAVEFHDSIAIPNVSTEDVKRVINNIISMGFTGIAMGEKNRDWLFLNNKKISLPIYTKFYLELRNFLALLNDKIYDGIGVLNFDR